MAQLTYTVPALGSTGWGIALNDILNEIKVKFNAAEELTVSYDGVTINKNSNNDLQTIAAINRRDNSVLPIWHGTEGQWINGETINWYNWSTGAVTGNFVEGTTTYNSATTVPLARPLVAGDKTLIQANWITYESVDGINLSYYRINNANVSSLAYGLGKYVAQAYEEVYTSTDLTNWTKTADLSHPYYTFAFGLNRFFAVTTGYTAVSNDGITWTEGTNNVTSSCSYAYLNAVGDKLLLNAYNDLWCSSDGFSWSTVTPFDSDYVPTNVNHVCGVVGSSYFILTKSSQHRRIYTTSDGVNWDYTEHDELSSTARIIYYAGCFWAIDFTIVDGITTNYLKRANTLNDTFITILNPPQYKSPGFYGFADKLFILPPKTGSGSTYNLNYVPISVYDCYTAEEEPTTASTVYSAPDTASALTVSSVTTGAIVLSDSNTYYRNQIGDAQTYDTIGNAHPEYLCFIEGVGVKKGNTLIANLTISE